MLKITDDKVVSVELAYGGLENEGSYRISSSLARSIKI